MKLKRAILHVDSVVSLATADFSVPISVETEFTPFRLHFSSVPLHGTIGWLGEQPLVLYALADWPWDWDGANAVTMIAVSKDSVELFRRGMPEQMNQVTLGRAALDFDTGRFPPSGS